MSNPRKTNFIAWWSLDEEGGTRADSHGSNNLTDQNTVLFGSGVQGNAADFERSNIEGLEITDNADLSFGDEDFTLFCWAKLESAVADMALMSKFDAAVNTKEYYLYYDQSDDRFKFVVSNDGTSEASVIADNLGSPSVDTWYFIVAWHDSVNNTINIQVNNGPEDSETYSSGCNDNTSKFALGGRDHGASGLDFYDGLLDEAGVTAEVWDASERTWMFNHGSGRVYSDLDKLLPNIVRSILSIIAPSVEVYDTRFKLRARNRDTALTTRVRNE